MYLGALTVGPPSPFVEEGLYDLVSDGVFVKCLDFLQVFFTAKQNIEVKPTVKNIGFIGMRNSVCLKRCC